MADVFEQMAGDVKRGGECREVSVPRRWDTSGLDVEGFLTSACEWDGKKDGDKCQFLCAWDDEHSGKDGGSRTFVGDGTGLHGKNFVCSGNACKSVNRTLCDLLDRYPEEAERFGATRIAGGTGGSESEDDEKGGGKGRPSQATRMVALFDASGGTLFRDGDTPYAVICLEDGRQETLALKSKHFKGYLSRLYYRAAKATPGTKGVADAIATLEGRAIYDQESEQHSVYVRLAGHEGKLYLDLANEGREVVEIGPEGWQIVANPPVRFRRPKGMLSLPIPMKGGSISELRPFINTDDEGFTIIVGWLIGAYHPDGPYPLLDLHGGQGSAKTTTARLLRSLIDPNEAPVRRPPREERDLFVSARNSWVTALDNLTTLPEWLSNTLCCVSTGGGLGKRENYTDDEEVIFNIKRPIILTGISDVVTASDLLDRRVAARLFKIKEDRFVKEGVFWAQVEDAQPRILGAILDAVAGALKNRDRVEDGAGRMADFAQWVAAAESTLGWEEGTFARAYAKNRRMARATALEASPVVPILRTFLGALAQPDGLMKPPSEVKVEVPAKPWHWSLPADGWWGVPEVRRAVQDRPVGGITVTRDGRPVAWMGSPADLFSWMQCSLLDRNRQFPANAAALARHLRAILPNLIEAKINLQFHTGGGGWTFLCVAPGFDPEE